MLASTFCPLSLRILFWIPDEEDPVLGLYDFRLGSDNCFVISALLEFPRIFTRLSTPALDRYAPARCYSSIKIVLRFLGGDYGGMARGLVLRGQVAPIRITVLLHEEMYQGIVARSVQ